LKRGTLHATWLLALLASTAASLAACSLVTTWDGLGPPASGDASTDASLDVRDVKADATPDVSSPATCTTGAYYCGGHVLAGDAGVLYKCASNGTGTVAIACARSCTRHTTGNDACACVTGSNYCGNDQVVGDPGTLYQCNGDSPATVVKICPGACLVRSMDDDICQ
jgi:hypothetical protein